MITIQDLLIDLDTAFETFFSDVIVDFQISLTPDEKISLQKEIYKLFKTTIFEVISELIPNSDKLTIEHYLALHPESSEFDTYFALAAKNPDANFVLSRRLAETRSQIQSFYNDRLI
jgi:hypothetical protein